MLCNDHCPESSPLRLIPVHWYRLDMPWWLLSQCSEDPAAVRPAAFVQFLYSAQSCASNNRGKSPPMMSARFNVVCQATMTLAHIKNYISLSLWTQSEHFHLQLCVGGISGVPASWRADETATTCTCIIRYCVIIIIIHHFTSLISHSNHSSSHPGRGEGGGEHIPTIPTIPNLKRQSSDMKHTWIREKK